MQDFVHQQNHWVLWSLGVLPRVVNLQQQQRENTFAVGTALTNPEALLRPEVRV